VPASFLLAVLDDGAGGEHVVGRVSVRHRLNDSLLHVGGHIGYAVRPAFRGRGYATRMLRLSLEVLRDLGVDRALVTCDEGNGASARTIEKCGGVLEDVRPGGAGRPRKRRYWIELG
jgi:predicted acetyltransferase